MLLFPLPVLVKTPPLPRLEIQGERMVAPSGQAVTLRGANMGNWLLLEFWMLGLSDPKNGGYGDQWSFENLLTGRFGAKEKDRMMELYRENFVTERDWRYMQDAKFNLVRLPFNYRLLEDDEKPYVLKPNAFKWLDRAVDAAERHGMYTILDLHGVQGGQTENDHTGRSGQNKLWTNEEDQKRAAWLWTQIAARYKNRSAVVAYDVFNEPYGGKRDEQVSVFKKLYAGVRKSDPDKLIFAHGHYDGFSHFGDPKEQGWKNVGFEMHYYPALFGDSRPVPTAHGQHLAQMELVEEQQNKLNVPFLIGEFNAVFAPLAPGIMRRHYDTYAKNGWMATMWSYKVMGGNGGIGGGNWGLVTNAEPLAKLDVRTASKAEIEGWMKRLSTIKLMPWAELMTALTDPNYVPPALPEPPPAITKVPANDLLPGWDTTDVNAREGGQKLDADGTIHLFGGGNDIWGAEDGFRFASQEAKADFEIEAEVVSLRDTNAYAKAGLMVRGGNEKDAPMLLLSVFPNGTAQTAFRAKKGVEAVGGEGVDGPLPTRLRLVRKAGKVEAFAAHGSDWKSLGSFDFAGPVRIGLVALSHDDRQLTEAVYRNVKVK
ncbi:hypothetical protein EON81_13765 [bacterium]|nr:MAG: hypothetical protein EON81_13765 [bacterium]